MDQFLQPCSSKKMVELKHYFENCVLVLQDEVSMNTDAMIGWMSQRLKEITDCKLPFGGLSVILMGDFYQLPPIPPPVLPIKLTQHLSENNSDEKVNCPSFDGRRLFKEFSMVNFFSNQRSKDPELTKIVSQMRESGSPITKEILDSLKILSKK